jgi:hypothetical protein
VEEQLLSVIELPCSDQILAQLIQAGGEILRSNIHKLINSTGNKKKLPYQWNKSVIVPVNKKGHETDCSNYQGDITAINIIQHFIQYQSLKAKSIY